jgi:Lrp/AsnC family transcriptional regulator
MLDSTDCRILDILQDDAMVPITTLAEAVGLSSTPCWRRVRKLEDEGYIRQRVALVDRRKVNVPMTIFVRVKAPRHEAEWLARFRALISEFPEIVEAWRLTGDVDYLLRLVVPNIDVYDEVYQKLIEGLEFSDLNSSIAMEEMKFTTSIPTKYAKTKR